MDGEVVGVVLAGGLSRRMGGGDKAVIEIEGASMLERVVARARAQVGTLLLNANGDPRRFAAHGLPVVADGVGGYPGPLAGVLTALEWAAIHAPDARWVVSFATDVPLLPLDLVERLLDAARRTDADIVCARSGGTTHPVFALWRVSLAGALRGALVDEDVRKIGVFMARHRLEYVDWPGGDEDPFFNVNDRTDLLRLRLMLAGQLPKTPPQAASLPVAVQDGVAVPHDGAGEPALRLDLVAGELGRYRDELAKERPALLGDLPLSAELVEAVRLFVAQHPAVKEPRRPRKHEKPG